MKSKKNIILFTLCILIIVAIVLFVGLQNKHDNSAVTVSLDEFGKCSEDEMVNLLIGKYSDNIIESWGEPDIIDTSNSVSYYLPEDSQYEIVSLVYDDNGYVVTIYLR